MSASGILWLGTMMAASTPDVSHIVFLREMDIARRWFDASNTFKVQFNLDKEPVNLDLIQKRSLTDKFGGFYGDLSKKTLVQVRAGTTCKELRGHFTTKRGTTYLISPLDSSNPVNKLASLLQKRLLSSQPLCAHRVKQMTLTKRKRGHKKNDCKDIEDSQQCNWYNAENMCTREDTELWMYNNCQKTCRACDRAPPPSG